MEFFEAIRKKIRKRKSWGMIAMLIFTGIYTTFTVSYVSSQEHLPIGLVFILVMCLVGVVSGFFMYREDKAYNTIRARAINYGGLDTVAEMLEELPTAPYAKGDLRLGHRIIFYFHLDHAYILDPLHLTSIKADCYSSRSYTCFYVTVKHKLGKERIMTDSAESAEMLCELMREVYKKQLEANRRKFYQ